VADTGGNPRPGRKEGSFDPSLPPHRVAFAQLLRDLRNESGAPSYRTLSTLSHCGIGSLSEAANGRRLPTWETARGYVFGCLRHAGYNQDVAAELRVWRSRWDDANTRELAHRAGQAPSEVKPSTPTARIAASIPEQSERPADPSSSRRPTLTAIASIVLLTLGLLGGDAVPPTAGMSGLYNILIAPFTVSGAMGQSRLPAALQYAMTSELRLWAQSEPAIQLRGPDGVDVVAEPDRLGALRSTAVAHGADIVIAGRMEPAGDRLTVAVELFLDERIVEETPELAGVHEISVTEPADVLDRNPAINERLLHDARDKVAGVVAFVRGLGDYALDDYAAAEDDFRAAAAKLAAPGRQITGVETVHLMLGNTIGRGDHTRLHVAADQYRTALAVHPSYPRALIGLAEAMRAGTSCAPGVADDAMLDRATEGYRAALATGNDVKGLDPTLLALKARVGLGLTLQCRTIAGLGNHWAAADAEFGQVLHIYEEPQSTGVNTRQRLRLAAEARAGQALTAFLTAERSAGSHFGGYPAAAQAYEDALALLHRVDVVRPTNLRRELTLLRNLKSVYQRLSASTRTAEVDNRITHTEAQLAALNQPEAKRPTAVEGGAR
jgi:hypothetical protein